MRPRNLAGRRAPLALALAALGLASAARAAPDPGRAELARVEKALASGKEDEARRELLAALASVGPLATTAPALATRLVRLEREGRGPLPPRIARLAAARRGTPPANALVRATLDLALAAVLAREAPPAPLPREPEDEPLALDPGAGSPWAPTRALLAEARQLDPTPAHALAAIAREAEGALGAVAGEGEGSLGADAGDGSERAHAGDGSEHSGESAEELAFEASAAHAPTAHVRLHARGLSGELTVLARPVDLEAALDDALAASRAAPENLLDLAGRPEDLALAPGARLASHALGETVVVSRTTLAGRPGGETLDLALPAALGSTPAVELVARAGSTETRRILTREDLAIVALPRDAGAVALALLDARTGAPVAGTVTLDELARELRGGRTRAFGRRSAAPTDEAGIAVLARDARFPRALVRARAADGRFACLWLDAPDRAAPDPDALDPDAAVEVFWERALVRPGEVARARLALRERHPERRGPGALPLEPVPGEELAVTLERPDGRALFHGDLALDSRGTATLELATPPDLAGELALRASFRGEPALVEAGPCRVGVAREGELRVTVAAPALVAPEALPDALPDRDARAPAPADEPLRFEVHASDALGAPLAAASVRARLLGPGEETLASDTVATDASGTAVLTWRAAAREGESLRFEALVRDASGREGAASASVLVARSEPRARLSWERRFVTPGEEIAVRVDVRARDGVRKLASRGRLELRNATGRVGEAPVDAPEGRGVAKWKLPTAGVYEVAYVASDSPARASATVYAISPDGAFATPLEPLELVPERAAYAPLERARVLVRTARRDAWVLLVARDAAGRARPGFPRAVDVENRAAVVELELDPSWIGAGDVEALAVSEGRLARARTTIDVRPSVEAPSVELATDRAVFKPGEKPALRIHVEARDGSASRRALVAVALEDADDAAAAARAAASRPPSEAEPAPLGTTLAGKGAATVRPHVRAAGAALILDRPAAPRGFALVREGATPPVPPAGFGVVETNENGDAQLALALPAVPGRWRVRARALPADGAPGATGELALATRPPLALALGAPGRLEVGDAVEVVACVSNDGDALANATLALDATPPDALEVDGDRKRKRAIPAHGQARVAFFVRARRASRVKLEARATATGEDVRSARELVIAGPIAEPAGATLALVGSTVAGEARASLVAPLASRVVVSVATPASVLGDLVARLSQDSEDPARGFAATLLARRALDARGEKWDAVAKRHGVAPDEALAPGDPGKGPRDPRRSPLFSKARLEALAKEGLAALDERAVQGAWASVPGGPADLEASATAVEMLVRARDTGAPVEAAKLEKGAAALDALLARAVKAAGEPTAGERVARARAVWALELAGKRHEPLPGPLDGGEAEVLSLLARLHVHAGEKPRATPAELDEARGLVRGVGEPSGTASDPGFAAGRVSAGDSSGTASDLGLAARRIELALALGDVARARAIAEGSFATALGAPATARTADHALALAELVAADPPGSPPGSVAVTLEGKTRPLALAADDPLLTDAAAEAPLTTSTPPGVPLGLVRHGKGVVAVVATALREPGPATQAPLALAVHPTRLERVLAREDGWRWLRGRWVPLAGAREGDLVRLELTLSAREKLSSWRARVVLPPALELIPATTTGGGVRVATRGQEIELSGPALAAGDHRVEVRARREFAAEERRFAGTLWVGEGPGVAVGVRER